MKKLILGLLLFTALVSACKKDSENSTPLSKEEMLCQNWDVETYIINEHSYAYMPRLFNWVFKTDGTIEITELETGNIKYVSTWEWAEEQEALDIKILQTHKEDRIARVNIATLTESKMVFEPGDSEELLSMKFSR